jgi:hypothetical protein
VKLNGDSIVNIAVDIIIMATFQDIELPICCSTTGSSICDKSILAIKSATNCELTTELLKVLSKFGAAPFPFNEA